MVTGRMEQPRHRHRYYWKVMSPGKLRGRLEVQGRTAQGVLWEYEEVLSAGVWDGCRAVWAGPGVVVKVSCVFMQGGRSRYGCLSPTPSAFQAGEWERVFDSRRPCPQLRVLKAQWAMTKAVRVPQSPGSGTGWV